MTSRNRVLLVVAVVVILFGGIVWFRARPVHAPTTSQIPTNTDVAGTTTTDLGNGLQVTGPAGAKVTILPSPTIKAPDLTHVVSFSSDVSPEAAALLKSKIASTTANLVKSPEWGSMWLQLAVYYKIAGDFKAAEAVWIYMTKVAPTNPVAFIDLGDLYQNYLVDYPKAEKNYLQATKLDPKNIDVYTRLFGFYKYQYKLNTTAAADIVAQGLKANPNDPNLLALQKQL